LIQVHSAEGNIHDMEKALDMTHKDLTSKEVEIKRHASHITMLKNNHDDLADEHATSHGDVVAQIKAAKTEIEDLTQEIEVIEKIVKNDDPTNAAGGRNKRTSIVMLGKDVQERFVSNEVHEIVQTCLDYEKIVDARNALVAIPDAIIANVSNSCVEIAMFISDKVDHLAIRRLVQKRPEEPPMMNEDVDVIKKQLIAEFVNKYHRATDAMSPGPQGVRAQARDRFFVKVRTP